MNASRYAILGDKYAEPVPRGGPLLRAGSISVPLGVTEAAQPPVYP